MKPEILHSIGDFTVYEGWKFNGWPIATLSRGNIVMEDGEIFDGPRFGKYVLRKLKEDSPNFESSII